MAVLTPLMIGPETPESALARFFAGRKFESPEGLQLRPITVPDLMSEGDLAWAWQLSTGALAGTRGVVVEAADYGGWLVAENDFNESDEELVEYALSLLDLPSKS